MMAAAMGLSQPHNLFPGQRLMASTTGTTAKTVLAAESYALCLSLSCNVQVIACDLRSASTRKQVRGLLASMYRVLQSMLPKL